MKKGGKRPYGYTIVEVLLFLAVSSALVIGGMSAIGGQQARTEFSQGIRDLQSKIDDVINDVATGYYTKSVNFSCRTNPSGPPIIDPTGTTGQGSNSGCIFLGRVLQFSPSGEESQMRIITVVGRQYRGAILDDLVTNYADANPRALFPTDDTATETYGLGYGLRIGRATYFSGGGNQDVGAIGFYSGLDQYRSSSATQSTRIVPIDGTSLGMPPGAVGAQINSSGGVVDTPVTLCFISASTNQHANIRIGSNQGRITTTLEIVDGSAC